MIIAVDVDDVLADFMDQFLIFHNETYNTSFKKEECFSFDMWKVFGGTEEEAMKKVEVFLKSEYFENITPIEGSLNAIKLLEEKHTLYVVTSRWDIVVDKTIQWLRKHYPGSFKGVHFCHYIKKIGKADLCRKIRAEVIIDDAETNILDCAKIGMTILVYDRPWNKHVKTSKKIIRVHNWNDILKEIAKLET